MSEERKKVLEMLVAGKITAEAAEKLLDKLASNASSQPGPGEPSTVTSPQAAGKPKYLRIVVDNPGRDQVNLRLPLSFVGSGKKILAVMPQRVSERLAEYGIDASILSAADCADLESLRDVNINVDRGSGKKVKIFCE